MPITHSQLSERLGEMQCFDESGNPTCVTGAAFYALEWLRAHRQNGALDLLDGEETSKVCRVERFLRAALNDAAFAPLTDPLAEEITQL